MMRALLLSLLALSSVLHAQLLPAPGTEHRAPQGHPSLEDLDRGAPPQAARPTKPRAPGLSRSDQRLAAPHLSEGPGTPEGSCSPAALAPLNGTAFVNAVAAASWTCLDQLWTFDTTVATVISPANVSAVAADVSASSLALAANALRTQKLGYFFQIAFYHEFYQSSVTYPSTTVAAARQAMIDIAASPEFLGPGTPLLDLRRQWSISVDSTTASPQVLGPIETLLIRFRADPSLAGSLAERSTVCYCMSGMARETPT